LRSWLARFGLARLATGFRTRCIAPAVPEIVHLWADIGRRSLRRAPALLPWLDRPVGTASRKLWVWLASLPGLSVLLRASALFRTLPRLSRPLLRLLRTTRGDIRAWVTAALTRLRYRHCATAAQVGAANPAAPIVIYRTLPLTSDEAVVADSAAVLEDEARLGPEGPGEDHAPTTVVPIRVVVGVVEDHDPEPHAGVRIGVPVAIAGVAVAVVTQESWVVVTPFHIVRDDVIVPLGVAVRHDALRKIGQRNVGVAAHAAVGDHTIVPMVTARDGGIVERIGGDHGEHVTDSGRVVDVEAVRAAINLELSPTADVIVLPRHARIQDPNPPVSVDAEQGNEPITVGSEVHACALTGVVGVVAAVGPDFHAGSVLGRAPHTRALRHRMSDDGCEQE
jgi:hypothetical protein